ncbi:MAG: methyltransferase domain-containing protein [Sedimentisphaerales bacterium]|nr:methyltransferase domain-containing protein [Sedimentisphaerales bacterium]
MSIERCTRQLGSTGRRGAKGDKAMSADSAVKELTTPVRTCPVCESTSSRPFLDFAEWRVNRCRSCGMVFLANPPAYEYLSQEHAWTSSYEQESQSRRRREPILHALEDVFRALRYRLRPDRLGRLIGAYGLDGCILDLGCGRGHRSVRKLPPTATPFGIEIEPGPARVAEQVFAQRGGTAWCVPALEGLSNLQDVSMDGALLIAYLEHETQPGPVLGELARVLRADAPVIIKVPNHASVNRWVRGRRWCGYRLPDHVNYFTPGTLKMLLARCGFVVVRSRFTDHLPFSDGLWLVARRLDPASPGSEK